MAEPIWYPANVLLRKAASAIQWVDLAGVRLDEPFYQQTLMRVGPRAAIQTSLDEEPPGAMPPVPAPSAFIFHISRCGSTLLCNVLRAMRDTHVVAEPRPLSTVLTPTTAEGWPYSEDECERQRDALLRRLVLRLGQPTTGPGGRYVLKFSSYCAMRLDLIRALWPRVPVVFLVRDPVEVMVSNFSRGSAWQGIWRRPVQASEMFGWVENSAAMSREEFSARVIGRLCHMATLYRGAPSLVMDYRELVSGGWRRILGFLGYPAPDLLEQAAIDEALSRDAKRPSGDQPHEADEAAKHARVTPEIAAAAGRWAIPRMQELLAGETVRYPTTS